VSDRKLNCDQCAAPATCVARGHVTTAAFQLVDAGLHVFCDAHCDHKTPSRCLPIVRLERGEEYDR
jgi:hypothetical protein